MHVIMCKRHVSEGVNLCIKRNIMISLGMSCLKVVNLDNLYLKEVHRFLRSKVILICYYLEVNCSLSQFFICRCTGRKSIIASVISIVFKGVDGLMASFSKSS